MTFSARQWAEDRIAELEATNEALRQEYKHERSKPNRSKFTLDSIDRRILSNDNFIMRLKNIIGKGHKTAA